MEKSKKSAVGRVEVWKLFVGERGKISKDLSVKIVIFYLLETILINELKIVLYGLKNGF